MQRNTYMGAIKIEVFGIITIRGIIQVVKYLKGSIELN